MYGNVVDIDHLLGLDLTDPASALEFRRGIAELVYPTINVQLIGTDQFGGPIYHLRVGASGNFSETAHHTIEAAWDDLPHYETSVDAALTLPLRLADYRLSRVGNGYNFTIYDSPTNENCVGYGDTAALAICRAWLRYRRAQSAPVATADEEA